MSEKIQSRHLERKAILYVRQSTLQQVQNNEESRRMQYAMIDRLRALGWRDVETIDEDLGKSAAGKTERSGFQRLVAEVSLDGMAKAVTGWIISTVTGGGSSA